ncbi:MAG: TerC family protein [Deltaproteobacteria bacterium]|nr:TerC family protein [Deltaproteobacteria bacterium]
MHIDTAGTPLQWVAFLLIIGIFLALDLGVFHRKSHAVSFREAVITSIVWITLSMLFNLYIYYQFGTEKALEFFAGYLVEKAMSVDNIFVFILVFSYFRVPREYQHRVLFFGILGAIVLRGVFILLGSVVIQNFEWVVYIFGALLVVTAYKLIKQGEMEVDVEVNPMFRLAKRLFHVTPDYRGTHFFVRENGMLLATPLFLVLVAVEASDLVFAIDSIPAIFGITNDPFIVFSSNIFAILGLRALYFMLEGVMGQFEYLRYGLAGVLGFVGTKMLVSHYVKIPIGLSLGVIALLLIGSVVASILVDRKRLRTQAALERGSHSEQPPLPGA